MAERIARSIHTPLAAALAGAGAGLLCAPTATLGDDFASVVVAYEPAPGQFINGAPSSEGFALNDPAAALGAPLGGSLSFADNSKALSLGGFGGRVTLAFADTVLDDPLNPLGLDAIVFGNAFWVGMNPQRRWAEAAVIEISLDANGNGLADDAWFLIPGSDIDPAAALDALDTQTWDDDPLTPTPPAEASWYPDPAIYSGVGPSFSTATFALPSAFDAIVLDNAASDQPALVERYVGYADLSPTLPLGDTDADGVSDDPGADAASFFTRPDNPFRVGIDPGSAGGDSFDIAWAIDPATGEPARLPGFDFIRLSTASNAVNPLFGEKSAEVSGVADVRAQPDRFDLDGDGRVDVEDLYAWHAKRAAGDGAADANGDLTVNRADESLVRRAVRADEANDVEGRR